ncbi:polymorphic toxin type 44 domain-containing protein [Saccharopolyspora shandongensis]|uniref:WXG100-like domain-containing protein n=1 Tax=Saccharopolyspora shandongensis TaxID=418495 RepID=UPI003415BC49
MPIPEPADPNGLWDAVKATGYTAWWWPETNEDDMYELSRAWHDAATDFTTIPVRSGEFGEAWPDPAGTLFAGQVEDIVDVTETVRLSCEQKSNHAALFADIVGAAKRDIAALVLRNSALYAWASKRPLVVHGVAAEVVRIMDDAAKSAEYLDSGVAAQFRPGDAFAEFRDVLNFMTGEMVNNSKDPRTRELIEKNRLAGFLDVLDDVRDPPENFLDIFESDDLSEKLNRSGAYAEWFELVKPGGEWDHKSWILDMTVEDNTETPIPGTSGEIRYDMWSNIHYGYVGREAGFSADDLHTGADVADYGTQGHTDPADQAAVQFGMDLHEKYGPDALTPEIVQQEIIANYDDLVRSGVIRPM